jgi:hypothetical protein
VGLAPVEAALICEAARLDCGPHAFDFTKTHAARDDVQLRLSHRADCGCERRIHGEPPRDLRRRVVEKLIPAVTGDLDPTTRTSIEEERLSAGGRALFAQVAHLVALAESAPQGKRGLRFFHANSPYERRTKVYPPGRTCSSPGCGTLLSTFNPSGYCAVHQRAVR